MKKRILAVVLCVLMCLPTLLLASCSKNTIDQLEQSLYGDATTSSNDAREICIYGITDPSTTETAIAEVEAALNQISVRKYNTKVKLLLFPEETYASIVFNKIQSSVNSYNTTALAELEKKNATDDEIALIKNIEFNTNDRVKVSSSIPSDVSTATMDIFLVYNPPADSPTLDPSSEYYNEVLENNGMFGLLYEAMALAPIKAKISTGTYSALKSNSYPEALDFATQATYKTMGDPFPVMDIYGIPNNYVYGGYKYLIINNDVVGEFISADEKDPSFNTDIASQSVTNDNVIKALRSELTANSDEVLKSVTEIEHTEPFTSYEEFLEYSKEDSFAIGYAEGDLALQELIERSKKYSVYKLEVAAVTGSNLCESMFCISKSATDYVDRCLDILLLINTDATFRNIFQYGVKDTHYNEGRDGTVYVTGTTTNRYVMDPKYTGNMFILTPSDSMPQSMKQLAANKWKLGKLQVAEVLDKFNNG